VLARLGLLRDDAEYHLLRASMVIIFFFFGYQKWFAYEVDRLIPFTVYGDSCFNFQLLVLPPRISACVPASRGAGCGPLAPPGGRGRPRSRADARCLRLPEARPAFRRRTRRREDRRSDRPSARGAALLRRAGHRDPSRCARTLDHGQSCARSTSRALTGLSAAPPSDGPRP